MLHGLLCEGMSGLWSVRGVSSVAAALVAVSLLGVVALPVGATSADGSSEPCGVGFMQELKALPPIAVDPIAPAIGTEWLTEPTTQAVLVGLRAELEAEPTFVEVLPELRAQRLVVLTDPGRERSSAVAEAISTFTKTAPTVAIAERPACRSKDRVAQLERAAQSALLDAAPQLDLRDGGIGLLTDVGTSEVVLRGKESDIGELARRIGIEGVRLEPGPTRIASRGADASPHYGGANFWTYLSSTPIGECTSAFTVTNIYTVRHMMTAAHCGSPALAKYGGALKQAYSGGWLIGDHYSSGDYDAWVPGNWFAHDVGVLYRSGQTYSNGMYTDPGAPTARFVSSYRTPGPAEPVCANGSHTAAVCQAIVEADQGQNCFNDYLRLNELKCVTDLSSARKTGNVVVQGGDSGGSVYQQGAGTSASATGVIHARYGATLGPPPAAPTDGLMYTNVSSFAASWAPATS